jgi:hypothetical protein
MKTGVPSSEAETLVRDNFVESGIDYRLSVRSYPEETIFVVTVPAEDLSRAAVIGNALDTKLSSLGYDGFVTVRKATSSEIPAESSHTAAGVHDTRVIDLISLIASRSRTSEMQPSLTYVRDLAGNVSHVTAPRHYLIFGRRGAGKTALMVEAKRTISNEGGLSVWMNIQTMRHEGATRIYLRFVQLLLAQMLAYYRDQPGVPRMAAKAEQLDQRVTSLLSADEVAAVTAQRLIPDIQKLLQRFLNTNGLRLFVFIDDFYYLPRDEQPQLLDMLHGSVRDTDAWLKIAAIRHLTRWYQTSPPLGLQTGHDAGHLDLDVSLQEPAHAKAFLEEILGNYARYVGITRLSGLFASGSLDRLVLASGAVPRDYLTLSAAALTRTRTRTKSRLVGTQDVNQAAGDAAQVKVQELEDDLAAEHEGASRTLAALERLRAFCLEKESSTYFRVDFRDKEKNPSAYGLLTSLLEVRLTHMIDPSISGGRAGERFEVFMLDLSQFSGARLKQAIRVLDLEKGVIVAKTTGRKASTRVGRTPRQVVSIYRAGPVLSLSVFHEMDSLF